VIAPLLVDAETPRGLVLNPPLTDPEFEALCFSSEWFRFERTREGEILIHPLTGALTGDGNSEVALQLRSWWKTHRQGRTFESSTGFFLPDGSIMSPDASYVLPKKLKGFTKDDLTGFPYLCPDFVMELLSKSDSLPKARERMERWLENGAALGWLIDPCTKKVHVYEPGRKSSAISAKAIRGRGPVEGFTLDLEELWHCYEI
jgi:Uma2 family endonuclease